MSNVRLCFPSPRASADVKEAVRLCYSEALAAALGKQYDAGADLRISIAASHPDAAAESSWLAPAVGAGGNRQRRGGRGGWQQQRQQSAAPPDGAPPALTDGVVARLASMPAAAFAAACPPSAAQLSPPAAPAGTQLPARRLPLHVGGRSLKLRRGIPQSPWVIDGQRKGEGSVQVWSAEGGAGGGGAAGTWAADGQRCMLVQRLKATAAAGCC